MLHSMCVCVCVWSPVTHSQWFSQTHPMLLQMRTRLRPQPGGHKLAPPVLNGPLLTLPPPPSCVSLYNRITDCSTNTHVLGDRCSRAGYRLRPLVGPRVHATAAKCLSAPRRAKSGEAGGEEQPSVMNYSWLLCTTLEPQPREGRRDAGDGRMNRQRANEGGLKVWKRSLKKRKEGGAGGGEKRDLSQ